MRWRQLKNSGLVVFVSLAVSSGISSVSLALTTVQSQVCQDFAAPLIVSPSDGTQTKDSSVMIEGTGEPGKTIEIIKGDVTKGIGAVASDGSFGLTVPLAAGDNTFFARETNECDTTKDSPPVTIHADLPVPPVTQPSGDGDSEEAGSESPAVIAPIQPGGAIGGPFTPRPGTLGFEKPKITSLKDGATVYLDTLLVEGTAHPGSLVTIYVNGIGQAQVIVSLDGNFRVRVVLEEGLNTIRVRSTLGDKTAASDEFKVTYVRRVTATLTRPLSKNEIATAVVASIAAVIGGAIVAVLLHRYGFGRERREK